MSDDQIPALPGKKTRQMPGVYPGGMFKLRFDWYITHRGTDYIPEPEVIYQMKQKWGKWTSLASF